MLRSMILHHGGFPIRKSADIMLICSSPRLIAACHVLLRLLMPRHSPYALVRLNFLYIFLYFGSLWIVWVSRWALAQPNFSFRIIDSFRCEKTFFRLLHFVLSCAFARSTFRWNCIFPFRLERLIYLLRLFVLFCSFSTQNYFLLFDCQRSFCIRSANAGRSGWTRTIDLALIRRAL